MKPSLKTTHVIATNLPDAKVKRLIGNEPICHPRYVYLEKRADFTR